jgi:hypothetical protein
MLWDRWKNGNYPWNSSVGSTTTLFGTASANVKQASIELEFPIMKGKMVGETIHMKTASTRTTIREVCVWISQQLGPANKVHRITLALGEYGCGTLVWVDSDTGEVYESSTHSDSRRHGASFADSCIGGYCCHNMPIPCHYEGIPTLFFPQKFVPASESEIFRDALWNTSMNSVCGPSDGDCERHRKKPKTCSQCSADADDTPRVRENPDSLESVLDAETINSIMSKLEEADPSFKGRQLEFCQGGYHREVSEAHEREMHVQMEGEQVTIVVKTLTGQTSSIGPVFSSYTIGMVKKLIEANTCIPANQQRLIFGGAQLEDETTLDCYKVSTPGIEYTLHLVLRLRGGGATGFIDVQNESAMVTHQWSSDGPDWRVVSPGLCIEGRCTNSRCAAYKHMVIHNNRFNHFDLHTSDNAACPQCNMRIKPLKPAFSNCFYKIVGVKADEHVTMYTKEWTRVGNEYTT